MSHHTNINLMNGSLFSKGIGILLLIVAVEGSVQHSYFPLLHIRLLKGLRINDIFTFNGSS